MLSYDINACCASATDPDVSRKIRSDLRQTPSVKVASIKTESDHGKDYDWQWLQDEDGCKSRLNVGWKQFIDANRIEMTQKQVLA